MSFEVIIVVKVGESNLLCRAIKRCYLRSTCFEYKVNVNEYEAVALRTKVKDT